MGTAVIDPEYDTAKKAFMRELRQFHESRGSKVRGTPEVNGKEVDVYLLYQVVTSHGGWEKINIRNEWDELLEHFHLPRATNGGLILKSIYLKYLELYEKIHFLGEDVDGRHDEEDDYDEIRHRRRYNAGTPGKPSSTSNANAAALSSALVTVTESNRGQLGMSTRLVEGGDYDRLLMSLQSPLPNDQDMAISVCTLLSNETKHVLKLPKAPRILDLLLAHAGIYNHCKLRELMEVSYLEARELSHAAFWLETVPEGPSRHVLCECFVEKLNYSIGIDEYTEYLDQTIIREADMTEEERGILQNRRRLLEIEKVYNPADCCLRCPCRGGKSENPSDPFPSFDQTPQPVHLIRQTAYSDDRVGQRITQIANILRNLSFEEDNAAVMAKNPTLLRFILASSECGWGTIPQLVLDLLGNLAQHLQLKEPSVDPLSCRVLSLVVNGLFSVDRFRILRSLEGLRELCKKDGNESILNQYVKMNVYKRMCELLTISDIMLLIYTLECLLSMTGLGEPVCNELCRVQGSVATLISLVTVEAQSYGPRGCILMRVVETVTGNLQNHPTNVPTQQSPAVVNPPPSAPSPLSVASVHSSAQISPACTPRLSPGMQSHIPAGSSHSSTYSSNTEGSMQTMMSGGHNHPSLLSQLQQPVQMAQPHVRQNFQVAPASASPLPQTRTEPSHQQCSPGAQSAGYGSVISVKPGPASTTSDTGLNATFANAKPQTVQVLNSNSTSVVAGSRMNPAQLPSSTGNGPIVNVKNEVLVGDSTVFNNVPVNNQRIFNPGQCTKQPMASHIMLPNISLPLVTPQGNLSEEGWALAWLKGAFEVALGSSIEQGESYRLYCGARKNPQKVLSLEQFIQCMKVAHGATVGPVIKQFGGGSSLSFFEGIRPKISVKSQVAISACQTQCVTKVTDSKPSCVPVISTPPLISPSGTLAFGNSSNAAACQEIAAEASQNAAVFPSVVNNHNTAHITQGENKTMSPILKATLSRPPKPMGVAQRQQKRLEEGGSPTKDSEGRVNGLDGNGDDESSASSSLNSSEETDSSMTSHVKNILPVVPPSSLTSFHGVLRNGINNEESKNIEITLDDGEAKTKAKGMLNHLLERKVPARENLNGILCNREIRISDKGLELIDKLEENTITGAVNSSLSGVTIKATAMNTFIDGGDSQSQMTFYSAPSEPQVTTLLKPANAAQNSISPPLYNHAHANTCPQIGNNIKSLTTVVSSNFAKDSAVHVHQLSDITKQTMGGGGNLDSKGENCRYNSKSVTIRNANEFSGDMVASGLSASDDKCSPSANVLKPLSSPLPTPCKTNSINNEGADLLEKFNQFSDLIVVSPEQLGIKRPLSTLKDEPSDSSAAEPPPPKKPTLTVNGNGFSSAITCSDAKSFYGPMDASDVTCAVSTNPVLQAALSTPNASGYSTMVDGISASSPSPNTMSPASSISSSASAGANVAVSVSSSTSVSGSAMHGAVNTSPSAGSIGTANTQLQQGVSPNQMMQLRLAVNSPNQLTFTRQLMLPSGQQLILSTKSQNQLQGQVLISKPHVSSNDQMAKAIIILQQPQQSQQPHTLQTQHLTNATAQIHGTQGPTSPVSQMQPSTGASAGQLQQPNAQPLSIQQNLSTGNQSYSSPNVSVKSALQTGTLGSTQSQIQSQTSNLSQISHPTEGISVPSSNSSRSTDPSSGNVKQEVSAPDFPYLCEWAGCGQRFGSHNKVFMHVSKVHTPETLTQAVRCEWGPNGCDPLLRKRLSLMTHLQDRHCTKQALEMSLYRRNNRIEPPPPAAHPVHPHLGYAPNAAFHAIRRHAMQFTNPKELMDDNEGPVTKSIRLTSSLILKNIVTYSSQGRRILRGYESQLASVAMSNVESSRTIAQLLYDLKESKS